jgi:magnesium transporter
VVVEKGDRVAGLLPLRRFLAAPPDVLVSDLMDPDPPLAQPGGDPNLAAHRMVERGHSSVVVVDDSGRLHGLVPAQEMISILLHEHDEDLARLGGYVAGARRARGAAREPVSRRLIHRLPWLVVGLLGAMLSAVIVGAFEDRLAQNLLVALFVPAVVYMADAVGTQTEALLIRAMASGVTVRSMVAREVGTGAIVGGVVGLSMAMFALAGWGDGQLALAVGIALFASCVIATILAMVFPALLDRLGQDPAFGSGPLATVAQDLLSIIVYFGVVVLVGA